MEKSKVFYFSLLCVIAGVAVASFFVLPVWFIWFLGITASLFFIFGLSKERRRLLLTGLFIILFSAGAFRLRYAEEKFLKVSQEPIDGQEVVGVVWDDPQFSALAQHLRVKVGKIGKDVPDIPIFIRVTTRMYPKYEIGASLFLQGAFEPAAGGFFRKEEVHFTSSFPQIRLTGKNKGNRLKTTLSRVKSSFEDKISLALPEPHSSFLRGLLLGERSSLSDSFRESLRLTGTSHLVALSGYNITLIGKNFMEALLFLTIPFRVSFWIAATAIFLFVLMTGASPSVVRAGIMGILILIAQKEGRLYNITNALLVAAVFMVLHNPFILRFDIAFQLSFLATCGLVFIAPRLDEKLSRIPFFFFRRKSAHDKSREGGSFIRRICAETLSAQLMVLPLLIFVFGEFSIISAISNPLVISATPLAMAAGFITGILGFFSYNIAAAVGFISWVILEYQMRIIEYLAKIPFAAVSVPSWVFFPLFLLYFLVLIKYIKRRVRASG